MWFRWIPAVTALLLLTSCLHVQEAPHPDGVRDVLAAGDLPQASGATARQLIASSRVPVVLMFTADWCKPCQEVKGDFWRAVRRNEARFVGVLVDADRNKEFYESQGAPALPAFTVYDGGKARWTMTGTAPFPRLVQVLKENTEGFDHGLTASAKRKDPKRAKIFLVAANADVANFVQEVHDLYGVWRARGYQDDDIACYWSVPNFGQYWMDRAQFKSMKAFAATCRHANLEEIENDWKAAAATKPPFMFFYVTAHGTGARQAEALKMIAARGTPLTQEALARPGCTQFFNPHVAFDAQVYPEGMADLGAATPDAFIDRMREACDGDAPRMKLLTKKVMQRMMDAASASHVVAVVQACHAGAVIPGSLPDKATMLAAAAPERSSFGCGEEGDHTYYGLAFINALRNASFDPKEQASWVAVHETVAKEVERRERELGLKPYQHSEPMIVSGSGR